MEKEKKLYTPHFSEVRLPGTSVTLFVPDAFVSSKKVSITREITPGRITPPSQDTDMYDINNQLERPRNKRKALRNRIVIA